MEKKFFCTLVMAGLVLLGAAGGCGDEIDPAQPETFRVTLVVTDTAGQPVPGLQLGLCADLPFYQDGLKAALATGDHPARFTDQLDRASPSPFNPATTIRFDLGEPAWVTLDILDIEGQTVTNLLDEERPAGSSAVMWNGRDNDQQPVPSGVYFARLVVRNGAGQVPRFEASRPMVLGAFYADQVLIGTTDQNGRLPLTDRRLFPYLYDLEPFPATDENGDPLGDIAFSPTMRFYLTDPVSSRGMRFDRDVTGSAVFPLTWDPAKGEQ